MKKYSSFSGKVSMIQDYSTSPNQQLNGCYQLMSVVIGDGSVVNFVIEPTTYFLDHVRVSIGDRVTVFYDANAPALMIYPPQYQALIIVKDHPYQNVKVDYFNSNLVSSDGQLKLNVSRSTLMLLPNNQLFTANPANRHLLVVYSAATMSIPAQTTPNKVIIMC